mgnify:CR=1 FL=1
MELDTLHFAYFQIDKWRRREGFSSWWLGGIGRKNRRFPSESELQKAFRSASAKCRRHEMYVETRRSSYLIIFLPTGVTKNVRRKFLLAITK